jgi:hypothetical protein
MNRTAFALLLLVNGLVLGALAGLLLGRASPADASAPSPAATPRYSFEGGADGRMSFFDSATGRHISFYQMENLWFVMTYDPESATVTYTRTRLVEDDSFLEAAQQLRETLPERLHRDLLLNPAVVWVAEPGEGRV